MLTIHVAHVLTIEWYDRPVFTGIKILICSWHVHQNIVQIGDGIVESANLLASPAR